MESAVLHSLRNTTTINCVLQKGMFHRTGQLSHSFHPCCEVVTLEEEAFYCAPCEVQVSGDCFA